MNTLILCLTFGGGLAVLLGGALRQWNDSQVAKERETQRQQREQEDKRLAEARHRETAAMIAARNELAAAREELAAKPNLSPAAKGSVTSSAKAIAGLDTAIEQAMREVSGDTAQELRRRAEQLRWFDEGRSQTRAWDQALRPQIERIFLLISEASREASAKGMVTLVSESPAKRPSAYVYQPYDGPMEGLDQAREMRVQEIKFDKFTWTVDYRAGYVAMSPSREVRPHEMVSPLIRITSIGQEIFLVGFGNRDPKSDTPLQLVLEHIPQPAAARLEKAQQEYASGAMTGDSLIATALGEAFKLCIVREDTSK